MRHLCRDALTSLCPCRRKSASHASSAAGATTNHHDFKDLWKAHISPDTQNSVWSPVQYQEEAPSRNGRGPATSVEAIGLEPTTPCLQTMFPGIGDRR